MELDWSSLKLIHSTPKKQYSVRERQSALKRYRLEEIRDDRRVERSWQQTPHTRGASSEHLREKRAAEKAQATAAQEAAKQT